ncbi:hypothetical protein MKW98_015166 [Papaver atlanticum]|uniref:DUF309 domain-containing protein n=1 Tax=Papaver atlanticum TaxID=357466 RepID=A0AAD4T984_9MAGN|nr:hypothetical protein MKW98_015166 [Papaver atlanticum]
MALQIHHFHPLTFPSKLHFIFGPQDARCRPPVSSSKSRNLTCSKDEEPKQKNFCFALHSYRLTNDGFFFKENGEENEEDMRFDKAVLLFNNREYYKCHDFLEALWLKAEDPQRTVIHGILQCAVGFHHLFNQNHRGAMMELGEGLCKLRKIDFQSGPLYQFEQEISATLEFIYQTQMELAACTDDMCLTMDGSERSYQLLGSFAAGEQLYHLENEPSDILYIVFCPNGWYKSGTPPRVKVPTLHATETDLIECDSDR